MAWEQTLLSRDLANAAREDKLSPKHMRAYQEVLSTLVNTTLPSCENLQRVRAGWKSYANGLNAETEMRNCEPWSTMSREARQKYVDRLPELRGEFAINGHATDEFLRETFPFEGADSYGAGAAPRDQLAAHRRRATELTAPARIAADTHVSSSPEKHCILAFFQPTRTSSLSTFVQLYYSSDTTRSPAITATQARTG